MASLWQKQADCTVSVSYFCTDAFTGNLHILNFSWIHIKVSKILQMFLHIWICWVKGFSKMYNWLQFAQFLCSHLLLKTRFCKQIFGFLQICHFFQIIEVEPKGFSKTLSNDPGLYHNKKMEGGKEKFDPSLGSQSINQTSGVVAFSIREVMIEYV